MTGKYKAHRLGTCGIRFSLNNRNHVKISKKYLVMLIVPIQYKREYHFTSKIVKTQHIESKPQIKALHAETSCQKSGY